MTRTLIFLAITSLCSAGPAFAQSSTRPPAGAGSTAPAKPDEKDVLEGLIKGIVKAVVEEAQKPKEEVPAEEPVAAPADPAAVAQPASAAAPAPQPQPAAAGVPLPAVPAAPIAPVTAAAPNPEPPPPAALAPTVAAPEPVAPPAGPTEAIPAETVGLPVPAIAEPPTDRPGRLWLLALLLPAAAAAAAAAVHRARVVRTKQLLSLEPRLEGGLGSASATAFDFAAPPVSIHCRMEMGAVHG